MGLKCLMAAAAIMIVGCGENPKCADAKCGPATPDPDPLIDADEDDGSSDLPCEKLTREQCGARDGCIDVSVSRYSVAHGTCELAEKVWTCRTPGEHCTDADTELVSCDANSQVWFSSHDCMPISHHECTAEEANLDDIYENRCQE
jgi:hypothetical protein